MANVAYITCVCIHMLICHLLCKWGWHGKTKYYFPEDLETRIRSSER